MLLNNCFFVFQNTLNCKLWNYRGNLSVGLRVCVYYIHILSRLHTPNIIVLGFPVLSKLAHRHIISLRDFGAHFFSLSLNDITEVCVFIVWLLLSWLILRSGIHLLWCFLCFIWFAFVTLECLRLQRYTELRIICLLLKVNDLSWLKCRLLLLRHLHEVVFPNFNWIGTLYQEFTVVKCMGFFRA